MIRLAESVMLNPEPEIKLNPAPREFWHDLEIHSIYTGERASSVSKDHFSNV
jgi:hypothetical protein